jgi:hypothetical protein
MPKQYAKAFPTDTPLEVYNPDNPPPAGTETDPVFAAWLASTYSHNIDGGFANSVYLAGQSVNGGGA